MIDRIPAEGAAPIKGLCSSLTPTLGANSFDYNKGTTRYQALFYSGSYLAAEIRSEQQARLQALETTVLAQLTPPQEPDPTSLLFAPDIAFGADISRHIQKEIFDSIYESRAELILQRACAMSPDDRRRQA